VVAERRRAGAGGGGGGGGGSLNNSLVNALSIAGFQSGNGQVTITSVVPEPEEYGMMLIGFGMVGWQVKRKQRKALPATM
jgi:hypothetical protein